MRTEPDGTLKEPYSPVPVMDIDIVYPVKVLHLMPPWSEIPAEFHMTSDNKWVKLFERLFYEGAKSLSLFPKDGIDPQVAWRHLRCMMRTFSTAHEYKTAAAAFLMDRWFNDITCESPEEKA
jgi:hypothetical protein